MANIYDIGINAVVSVICSWLVASVYFRKVTRAEQVAEQIRHGLQRALLPTLHPHFFDQERSLSIYPEQNPPGNADIPYVEVARVTPRRVGPGGKLDVLLKLRDSGYDLDNPEGVSVHDHLGRAVGVTSLGLGFCRCTIPIEDIPASYEGEITIELRDAGLHTRRVPNQNVQTLRFTIEKGDQACVTE